jgi:hypothetical protein
MTKKLLRVTGSTYTAVAILTQVGGAWTVTHTAPSLAWMHGLDMATIKQRLVVDGARWEWAEISEQFATIAERRPPASRQPAPAAKRPTASVTAGEQAWFNGVQNAIKAEQRKAAIVRNVRGKRKKVTE